MWAKSVTLVGSRSATPSHDMGTTGQSMPHFVVKKVQSASASASEISGICFLVWVASVLTGVLARFACGLFFVIRTNHHEGITVVSKNLDYLFKFPKNASFINKNEFRRKLRELPNDGRVLIDATRALFIDHHITEILEDFRKLALYKNIQIELKPWESCQA